MATQQELIEYLIHNSKKFYEWMSEKGYTIQWIVLPGGLGYSFYIQTPDGQGVFPYARGHLGFSLIKKPISEINPYVEGWIGYESLKKDQPPWQWYHRTGIHKSFVNYVQTFNALPEWI